MIDDRVQLYFFYDDSCELCMRFKEWVEGRDGVGRIEALPLGGEGLEERFPMVDFEMAREQLTVCDRRGEVYEGTAALRVLARHFPGLGRLDWIYRLPGVQTVAGGVYRTVNRFRKR